ncbi:MAG: hypothetical protein U0U67_12850 [Chitinophagales bacterium]
MMNLRCTMYDVRFLFRKSLATFSLLLTTYYTFAQIEKGDKLYNDYKYAQAAELYKPEADKGNIRAIRKIAECYRKINDYDNAEKYYALVVADKNAVPKSFLYYGEMLLNNEKYDSAKVWLQKYYSLKTADSLFTKALLASCEKGKTNVETDRKIKVRNLEKLNSKTSDFCAVPFERGILFTSTRDGKINGTSGMGYQQVYFAKMNKDSSYQIESVKGVINTKKMNSGPACVDTLHDIIYFTKNNFQYGDAITNKKGDVTIKIFSAERNRDGWNDIKLLELNDVEYSCAFPTINKQGTTIYFASDRAGGFGGKDIYFSVKTNGVWSKPKNCGKAINTSGDERYPFIHADGTLYFSSNGYPGFGGMDIYKSVPNKIGEFGKPENLGKPFNSSTDDFGFYLDGNYDIGYFSSDREGGKGMDDIYEFQYTDIPLEITFYNNGKTIDSVQVIIEKDGKVITDAVAVTKFTEHLEPNSNYVIKVSKEGFVASELKIKTTQNKKSITKSISLTPILPEAEKEESK